MALHLLCHLQNTNKCDASSSLLLDEFPLPRISRASASMRSWLVPPAPCPGYAAVAVLVDVVVATMFWCISVNKCCIASTTVVTQKLSLPRVVRVCKHCDNLNQSPIKIWDLPNAMTLKKADAALIHTVSKPISSNWCFFNVCIWSKFDEYERLGGYWYWNTCVVFTYRSRSLLFASAGQCQVR